MTLDYPSSLSADAAIGQWRGIATALVPVIGAQGFAALFRRSLHLAKNSFPVLRFVEDAGPPFDFTSLHGVLEESPESELAAIHGGLIHSFNEILIKLIGEVLTKRLLASQLSMPSITEHRSNQDPTP